MQRYAKGPTLEDVASECGVSRATVSRVINRSNSVSSATIDRVQKALVKLGYTPNSSARILSGGLSRTLVLMLPATWRSYYGSLLHGIEEAATKHDYHVLIKANGRLKSVLNLVRSRQIDGMIVRNTSPSSKDIAFYKQLNQMRLPCVHIGNVTKTRFDASVMIDNVGGSRRMAHHLADRGYRRILFITGPKNNTDSEDRISGFKLGWDERGCNRESLVFREGDYSQDSGYHLAHDYTRTHVVDAVYAANDRMALGVMLSLRRTGLRIPEDVAVAGFDNDFCSQYLTPALTTVNQPMYDMGFMAAQNLILLIEEVKLTDHRVLLPAELIVRDST